MSVKTNPTNTLKNGCLVRRSFIAAHAVVAVTVFTLSIGEGFLRAVLFALQLNLVSMLIMTMVIVHNPILATGLDEKLQKHSKSVSEAFVSATVQWSLTLVGLAVLALAGKVVSLFF